MSDTTRPTDQGPTDQGPTDQIKTVTNPAGMVQSAASQEYTSIEHLILRVVMKVLFAPIIVFALYVQFHGDYGPGGGFQAGVIFAVAFILHALIFGLEATKKALPQGWLSVLMVVGVLLYAGTGVANMLLGGHLLDYDTIDPQSTHHAGQHYGILIVEFGVGVAVASTMLMIFYQFASREPEISDEEW